MIDYVPSPQFKSLAALFFLDSGHYLFRRVEDGKETSKFVTSVDVAAAFSMKEIDTGWLPPGIVRCGQNAKGPWFVYSTPGQKVRIILEKAAINGDDIGLLVPAPRLVLLGCGNSYWLAAMMTKHFDPDAGIYEAPFPNVYLGGSICWGSSIPPKAQPENARQVWDLFFESHFNGDLKEEKSRAFPRDIRSQLAGLDGRQARTYPSADLCPMNRSVEEWAKQKLGGD